MGSSTALPVPGGEASEKEGKEVIKVRRCPPAIGVNGVKHVRSGMGVVNLVVIGVDVGAAVYRLSVLEMPVAPG